MVVLQRSSGLLAWPQGGARHKRCARPFELWPTATPHKAPPVSCGARSHRRVKLVESAKNCSMEPLRGPVVRKVKKRTGLQAQHRGPQQGERGGVDEGCATGARGTGQMRTRCRRRMLSVLQAKPRGQPLTLTRCHAQQGPPTHPPTHQQNSTISRRRRRRSTQALAAPQETHAGAAEPRGGRAHSPGAVLGRVHHPLVEQHHHRLEGPENQADHVLQGRRRGQVWGGRRVGGWVDGWAAPHATPSS